MLREGQAPGRGSARPTTSMEGSILDMILTIAGLLLLALFLAGAVGLAYVGWGIFNLNRDSDMIGWTFAWVGSALSAIFFLGLLAIMVGEVPFSDALADGCYQVYSESDTTFVPSGNSTVVPITYNDRHFIPIRCP